MVLACLLVAASVTFTSARNTHPEEDFNSSPEGVFHKGLQVSKGNQFQKYNGVDTVPKTNSDTIVIPFQYQQSSLFYPITYKLMDSVAEILIKNELVTLSIDGYSYFDEGNDNICYYLSLNRALSVKYYVLGRGVDSSRVLAFQALSKFRSIQRKANKEPVDFNCTAEIVLNYPIPPPPVVIQDTDADGIADGEDGCPAEYGDKAHNGCPDKNAIIVPFEPQQSSLLSVTYSVLDSVISILRSDSSLTISIEGHAYEKEGVTTVCERLAEERADIVKRYLLTRNIDRSRIDSIKSFGSVRPITAGRNSWEKARNSRAVIFITHH
ncbi:MAG: cell envelope biosis protein OmpA [Ferruginibacter sp.]|nr:cell envelope biosis protein OmpA [Ferruginibacter sp.]